MVTEFNKGFTQSENWGIEEDNEEGEGQDTSESDETTNRGISAYDWFSLLDSFSSVTNFNWEECLEQPIGLFFNVLSYIREKSRREQEKIKQFKRTGKF